MAKGAESVAEVLGEISRDHLECSICHERYQTPKILHCLHSFCEKCLLTYQKSAKSSSVIECPVCRQLSALTAGGARDLKTNFHLMEIVADVALKEKLSQKEGLRLLCELCEDEREAQSRCMECSFLLCRQCQAAHRRIVATANHEVLSLDALRSGEANLQRKAKVEPPCEKHQGEKKRFFCKTCGELICRDCTVVEHREHKFTTIDDAASRLRRNTKELIVKLREQLSWFEETKTDLSKMDADLKQSVQRSLDQRAVNEDKRISQYEYNALEDIRHRENYCDTVLENKGVSLGKQSRCCAFFLAGTKQEYCKTEEETFSTIDNTLKELNQTVERLLTTKNKARVLMDDFKRKVRQDASSDKSKVADSKTKMRSQLDILSNQRKNFIKESDKITSVHISRMRHTLDIAGDLVESASLVDYLNLQSVIDGDIHALLKLDLPKLYPGYAKLEFKSICGTGLGQIIAGTTWNWERDIVPCSDKRDSLFSSQLDRQYYTYADSQFWTIDESLVYHHDILAEAQDPSSQKPSESQIIITGIAAFRKNEILVCGADSAVLAYDTSGVCTMETEISMETDKVASLADGSFITLRRAGRSVRLFSPNSTSPKKKHRIRDSANRDTGDPVTISGYGDEEYIVCCSNLESVLVVNSSTGSLVRQLPVGMTPDFLASRSKGQILLGSRNPASGKVIESNGTTALYLLPFVESRGVQLECTGVCCDGQDNIYMAVLPPHSPELHIHQYNPIGFFVGCSILRTEKPIVDITVTGDGKLVLAEENSLKLFAMTS